MRMISFLNCEDIRIPNELEEKTKCKSNIITNSNISEAIDSKATKFIFYWVSEFTETTIRNIYFIKSLFRSIPLVLMSSRYQETIGRWALRAPIWDYIVVPSEVNYIAKRIQCYFRFIATRNEGRRIIYIPNESIPPASDSVTDKSNNDAISTYNALRIIETSFNQKLSVTCLAKACKMSENRFTRTFKEEHGQTPRTFIKVYRIEQAKSMLRKGRLRIQQIAYSVGFEDVSHFNRTFKSLTNQTPREYRFETDSENYN